MRNSSERIAVIGLGYVGLPVAVALAEQFETVVGFDISQRRVEGLRQGQDATREVESDRLVASKLKVTADPAELSGSTFFIVTVPTPIDAQNLPDLEPIHSACRTIGPHLSANAVVVFESTVYPGVTEDICGPLLEKHSGLKQGRDFFLGYSPERINPGDKEHRLENIVKVVAAENEPSLQRLRTVYGSVVTAGLHEAPTIKVAEAAKVIENTQRDLNIALMNEIALICDKLDIRTHDVLEAAGTKWNFLRFTPGLVGGHCIGVDPYYLTHASKNAGHSPDVILAGRRINDAMGAFIASKTLSMVESRTPRIGVLGLTFKEDVPDLRNSKVPDIVSELEAAGATVLVHDPHADEGEARHEYGIDLAAQDKLRGLDAIVLAVAHSDFKYWTASLGDRVKPGGAVVDVKSFIDQSLLPERLQYWSL